MKIFILTIVLISCTFMQFNPNTSIKEPQSNCDTITAYLGAVVWENSACRSAKTFNRITSASKLEILIYPEVESSVFLFSRIGDKYIPYINKELTVKKINHIPGENKMIGFDGNEKLETLMVIVSISEDSKLKNAWNDIEEVNNLINTIMNSDLLTEEVPQTLTLGGNFRDIEKPENILKQYTGNCYIHKEFRFEIGR